MFHLNLNLSQDPDLIGYRAPGTPEPLPWLKNYVTTLGWHAVPSSAIGSFTDVIPAPGDSAIF